MNERQRHALKTVIDAADKWHDELVDEIIPALSGGGADVDGYKDERDEISAAVELLHGWQPVRFVIETLVGSDWENLVREDGSVLIESVEFDTYGEAATELDDHIENLRNADMDYVHADYRIQEVPGAASVKKEFAVWITLVRSYDAVDDGEAFEMAMNDIENRDGMEISSHEVIAQ
jgi:hypothetical protein